MVKRRALTVALVQFSPGRNADENFEKARPLVEKALRRMRGGGPRLVALPEASHVRGPKDALAASAEPIPGPWTKRWGDLARKHRVWILAGTMAERTPEGGRPFNTAPLLDPRGRIVARYRKIHLFDADLPGKKIRESDGSRAGNRPVVADVGGVKVGILVCFDLRFGWIWEELVRRGAEAVLLPSNFTRETGKAHWTTLVRARAIESQCYVAAPACWGTHPGLGIDANGEAMVVDPWGEVLAKANVRGDAVLTATVFPSRVAEVRRRLPLRRPPRSKRSAR